MKSLRQILVETFMHERDLPSGKVPFANVPQHDLENTMHDELVHHFVHKTLTQHYWDAAKSKGWDTYAQPTSETKEDIRKIGFHNIQSLSSEQRALKIHRILRVRYGNEEHYHRIRNLAKQTASEQLEAEHGLKLQDHP